MKTTIFSLLILLSTFVNASEYAINEVGTVDNYYSRANANEILIIIPGLPSMYAENPSIELIDNYSKSLNSRSFTVVYNESVVNPNGTILLLDVIPNLEEEHMPYVDKEYPIYVGSHLATGYVSKLAQNVEYDIAGANSVYSIGTASCTVPFGSGLDQIMHLYGYVDPVPGVIYRLQYQINGGPCSDFSGPMVRQDMFE